MLYSIVLYRLISIICQTFFYGIYCCLFPISIYIMVTKGLQTRSRKWLFAVTITTFALSTMYWVMSVVVTFIAIDVWRSQFDLVPRNPPPWSPIFDGLILVNYIVIDGVVVWRAWVLCSDQNRVVLMFPVIILFINTLVYLSSVALSTAEVIFLGDGRLMMGFHFDDIVNFMQVATMALSLLANIFATSIIAVKAWKYRKTLTTSAAVGIRTPTRAIRILGLVVESGMFYIFIGVVVLVSAFINLPSDGGTLSSIFGSVTVHLAGMYPIAILLLVETNRSLDTTYFSSSSVNVRGGQRSRVEPMSFAAGPVLTTSIQIEIESQASQPSVDGHDGASVKATSLPAIIPVS